MVDKVLHVGIGLSRLLEVVDGFHRAAGELIVESKLEQEQIAMVGPFLHALFQFRFGGCVVTGASQVIDESLVRTSQG